MPELASNSELVVWSDRTLREIAFPRVACPMRTEGYEHISVAAGGLQWFSPTAIALGLTIAGGGCSKILEKF